MLLYNQNFNKQDNRHHCKIGITDKKNYSPITLCPVIKKLINENGTQLIDDFIRIFIEYFDNVFRYLKENLHSDDPILEDLQFIVRDFLQSRLEQHELPVDQFDEDEF